MLSHVTTGGCGGSARPRESAPRGITEKRTSMSTSKSKRSRHEDTAAAAAADLLSLPHGMSPLFPLFVHGVVAMLCLNVDFIFLVSLYFWPHIA